VGLRNTFYICEVVSTAFVHGPYTPQSTVHLNDGDEEDDRFVFASLGYLQRVEGAQGVDLEIVSGVEDRSSDRHLCNEVVDETYLTYHLH